MKDIVETSYDYGYQDGYLAALDYLEMTIKTDCIFPTMDPYLKVSIPMMLIIMMILKLFYTLLMH